MALDRERGGASPIADSGAGLRRPDIPHSLAEAVAIEEPAEALEVG